MGIMGREITVSEHSVCERDGLRDTSRSRIEKQFPSLQWIHHIEIIKPAEEAGTLMTDASKQSEGKTNGAKEKSLMK